MPKALRGAKGPIFRLWHLHGTAALVHDDAYHMAVPITCNAVVDHVTNMEDKSSSREWPSSQMAKVWDSFQLQSEAPGLLGCNPWPLLPTRDLQPDAFTHEGGGAGFLNLQTFVLHGAGRFKSTHSIVNRHDIA